MLYINNNNMVWNKWLSELQNGLQVEGRRGEFSNILNAVCHIVYAYFNY